MTKRCKALGATAGPNTASKTLGCVGAAAGNNGFRASGKFDIKKAAIIAV
ncbi:MAG: hypothetical protein AAB927_00480 [Patescibacteria group bacterium]